MLSAYLDAQHYSFLFRQLGKIPEAGSARFRNLAEIRTLRSQLRHVVGILMPPGYKQLTLGWKSLFKRELLMQWKQPIRSAAQCVSRSPHARPSNTEVKFPVSLLRGFFPCSTFLLLLLYRLVAAPNAEEWCWIWCDFNCSRIGGVNVSSLVLSCDSCSRNHGDDADVFRS